MFGDLPTKKKGEENLQDDEEDVALRTDFKNKEKKEEEIKKPKEK